MRRVWLIWMVALTLAAAPVAVSAAALENAEAITREVNVTRDSSRGWTPTLAQRRGAVAFLRVYFDTLAEARYAEAYAMHAEAFREQTSLETFERRKRDFAAKAGAVEVRRVQKMTWTRDSPRAPFPGIFVALDLTADFVGVDRHCGFVLLFQPETSAPFAVMREEFSYLDNATAASIASRQSLLALDKAWRDLSRFCPNYTPLPSGPRS